ncbi:MAG: 16S rRNA (adenine(1518)-N(6)/adenine(1519)-N(6))-dimethyltransferase RsmA [Spirochaetia bacterium]
MNYGSVREIKELLEKYNIGLKKRWGQNYLLSHDLRHRITAWAGITGDSLVWEIGPGIGSLTGLLAQEAGKLILFEIDWGIIRVLEDLFGDNDNIVIRGGDFLDTFRNVRNEFGEPDRIVGNLPYRSAGTMIAALIENGVAPRRMVFMVQKELADRMTAVPGTKAFSAFTVLCRSGWRTEVAGEVKPGSFYPAPEVSSVVVIMEPDGSGVKPLNFTLYKEIVRQAFVSRRKKISNNLKKMPVLTGIPDKEIRGSFADAGISPEARAEELRPEEFARLADALHLKLQDIQSG